MVKVAPNVLGGLLAGVALLCSLIAVSTPWYDFDVATRSNARRLCSLRRAGAAAGKHNTYTSWTTGADANTRCDYKWFEYSCKLGGLSFSASWSDAELNAYQSFYTLLFALVLLAFFACFAYFLCALVVDFAQIGQHLNGNPLGEIIAENYGYAGFVAIALTGVSVFIMLFHPLAAQSQYNQTCTNNGLSADECGSCESADCKFIWGQTSEELSESATEDPVTTHYSTQVGWWFAVFSLVALCFSLRFTNKSRVNM